LRSMFQKWSYRGRVSLREFQANGLDYILSWFAPKVSDFPGCFVQINSVLQKLFQNVQPDFDGCILYMQLPFVILKTVSNTFVQADGRGPIAVTDS
jgi:hypothetical protein